MDFPKVVEMNKMDFSRPTHLNYVTDYSKLTWEIQPHSSDLQHSVLVNGTLDLLQCFFKNHKNWGYNFIRKIIPLRSLPQGKMKTYSIFQARWTVL